MKKTLALLLVTLLLFTTAGCSQDVIDPERGYIADRIVISTGFHFTHILHLTIMVMDLLAPLLPDDVTVEWAFIDNVADLRDAALAGHVDIFISSTSTAIAAIESDLPLQILSNHVTGYAQILSTNENIRSIADLTSNSRITVSARGSTPHLLFALYSREALGDALIFENNLVSIPNPEAVGLIQTTQDYDAFILTFPSVYLIPDETGHHQVADLTPTALRHNIGTYTMAREAFAHENPVLLQAFMEAMRQAVYLLNNNTDEMAEILTEYYQVDAALIADVIRRCPPRLELTGYDEAAELLYEMGILSAPARRFSELPNYHEIP